MNLCTLNKKIEIDESDSIEGGPHRFYLMIKNSAFTSSGTKKNDLALTKR